MVSTPAAPVSVRQFAKLDGCSHTLVAKAIKQGKLPVTAAGLIDPALAGTGWRQQNRRERPVETGGGNTPSVATAVSTSAAAVETPLRRRGQAGAQVPADPMDFEDEDFVAEILAGRFKDIGRAEAVKENGLAARSLMAARKAAGDVVDLEVAEAVLFEQARQLRDAWLNWPARVGPLIAATMGVPPEPVVEVLTEHVQQQLRDLGEPDADFAAPDEE